MDLQLTSAEVELLSRILESRGRDLEHQIGHTDHHEFKQVLQREHTAVTFLLERLRMPDTGATDSRVLLSSS